MDKMPWPDCGKEFEDWFKRYIVTTPSHLIPYASDLKVIAMHSWDAAILHKKGKTMEPHQQRVVDEKKELDIKATALSQFIGLSPIFDTLYPEEQERLKVQNDIMWQYSEILGARIAVFTEKGNE